MLCEHGNQLHECEICKSGKLNQLDITQGFRDKPNDYIFDELQPRIGIDVSDQIDNPLIKSESTLEKRLKTFPLHTSGFHTLNNRMQKKTLEEQHKDLLNQYKASDIRIGDSMEITSIPKKFLKRRE